MGQGKVAMIISGPWAWSNLIARGIEDVLIFYTQSLEGSRLRLPGRCKQRPSRAPGAPIRRHADTPTPIICGCGYAALRSSVKMTLPRFRLSHDPNPLI